jgi:hypothetical protein
MQASAVVVPKYNNFAEYVAARVPFKLSATQIAYSITPDYKFF